MTTVNAAQSAVDLGAVAIDRDELKDSLARVINALTGSKKEGSALANERISEDILYAALVHEQLKREQPALAAKLLKNIPRRYKADMKERVNQPLYNAVQEVLTKAVQDKKLSKARSGEISRAAFGKAQLDSAADHLRRIPKQVAAPAAGPVKPNVEAIIDKAEANRSATRRETRDFENYLEKHRVLSPAQIKTRRKLLKQIDPKVSPLPASPPASAAPAPAPTVPPAPAAPAPDPGLPDVKTIPSGPHDLAYQPESASDGKVEVKIPLSYSDDVSGVSIFDRAERRIADLVYSGRDEWGRSVFRGDRGGRELGDYIGLELHFREGDNYRLGFDPREYQRVTYAPE